MTRRHGRPLRAARELLQRPVARLCRARSPVALALQGAVAAVAETAVRKRPRKAAAPPPPQSVSVCSRSSAWLFPVAPQGQPMSAISGAICHCAPRNSPGAAEAVGDEALADAAAAADVSAGAGVPP